MGPDSQRRDRGIQSIRFWEGWVRVPLPHPHKQRTKEDSKETSARPPRKSGSSRCRDLGTQDGVPSAPGPALTCVRGRAARSPGPPGSGGQAWGRWTCPPETCLLDTRSKAHRRYRAEGEGASCSLPGRSQRRLPQAQPGPGLGNRAEGKAGQLRMRENLRPEHTGVLQRGGSPPPFCSRAQILAPPADAQTPRCRSLEAGAGGAPLAATPAGAGQVQGAPLRRLDSRLSTCPTAAKAPSRPQPAVEHRQSGCPELRSFAA